MEINKMIYQGYLRLISTLNVEKMYFSYTALAYV